MSLNMFNYYDIGYSIELKKKILNDWRDDEVTIEDFYDRYKIVSSHFIEYSSKIVKDIIDNNLHKYFSLDSFILVQYMTTKVYDDEFNYLYNSLKPSYDTLRLCILKAIFNISFPNSRYVDEYIDNIYEKKEHTRVGSSEDIGYDTTIENVQTELIKRAEDMMHTITTFYNFYKDYITIETLITDVMDDITYSHFDGSFTLYEILNEMCYIINMDYPDIYNKYKETWVD